MARTDNTGPYGLTLYLEVFFSLFRFLPACLPATLIVGLGGQFALFGLNGLGVLSDAEVERWYDGLIQLVVVAAGMIAVLPVGLSVLTLWGLRGGYWLTAKELDARPPSTREWRVLGPAIEHVMAQAPAGTIGPERWLVLDKIDLNAGVMGRAIYIHRALINSEYLAAVVAHELGHLNHGDGRLTLALRRLVPPPFSLIKFERFGLASLLLMVFGGGMGLLLMTFWWNGYWREREFLADRFAYECGQADGLIELLDLYQFFDVAVPFGFLWRSHPHDEERIDRLQGYLEDEADALDEPLTEAWAGEFETAPQERRRGFTDVEASLGLVVIDENHAGSTPAAQLAVERAWIDANGRRIIANAYVGHDTFGRGVVLIHWTADESERLSGRRFTFLRQGEHAKHLHSTTSTTSPAMQEIGLAMRASWEARVGVYDPMYQLIVLIISVDAYAARSGVSYYLLEPTGGGTLEERVMELLPQEQ